MSDTPAIIRIGRHTIAIHTLATGWRITLDGYLAWEAPTPAALARKLARAIDTALLEGGAA